MNDNLSEMFLHALSLVVMTVNTLIVVNGCGSEHD